MRLTLVGPMLRVVIKGANREGELLQPVGKFKGEKKGEGGLRFEAVSDGLKVRVLWSHLKLGPVGFNGEALVKGRSKVWVPKKVRDGPGGDG